MTNDELAAALEAAGILLHEAAGRLRGGAGAHDSMPPPRAHPPDALLTLAEAAAYVRTTPAALRCAAPCTRSG